MFTYKDPQRVAGRSPAFKPAPGGLLSLPAWGWLWACFLSSISHVEASRLGQAGRTRPDLGCQHDTMRGPEQASLWTSLVPAMAGPLVSSGPTGSPAQTGSPAGPRPFRLRFSPGRSLRDLPVFAPHQGTVRTGAWPHPFLPLRSWSPTPQPQTPHH